ncbi:MAG: hypothetical protein KTR30_06820 [Saprospiraceae bacterium]|nr:hypothetical protein [Saprospiraceae bacterium]
MDKSRHDIEAEIERTLGTVDEIGRVDGNPYLYTRIKERRRQPQAQRGNKLGAIWGVALAALLFLINISSVFVYYQKSLQADQAAGIEAIASEYGLMDEEAAWDGY